MYKRQDQGLLRAGSVAGILALILLLLALVIFLLRRRPTGPMMVFPPMSPDAWTGTPQWPPGGWEQPGLGSIETPPLDPPEQATAEGPSGAPTAPNDAVDAVDADEARTPDEDPAGY